MGLVLEIFFFTVNIKRKEISAFTFICLYQEDLKLKSFSFLLTHSVAVRDGINFPCFVFFWLLLLIWKTYIKWPWFKILKKSTAWKKGVGKHRKMAVYESAHFLDKVSPGSEIWSCPSAPSKRHGPAQNPDLGLLVHGSINFRTIKDGLDYNVGCVSISGTFILFF